MTMSNKNLLQKLRNIFNSNEEPSEPLPIDFASAIPAVLQAQLGEIAIKIKKNPISDVEDDEDNQYVDLVMEGGGVLGIALLGYTYALEQMGIRFLNIAGTSAGAINALFLAAAGTPAQNRSDRLMDILSRMDLRQFMDGGRLAVDFTDAVVTKKSLPLLISHALPLIPTIIRNFGIHPGDIFLKWVKTELEQLGVTDAASLKQKMSQLPKGFKIKESRLNANVSHAPKQPKDSVYFASDEFAQCRLVVVASEVTAQEKAQFPEDAARYWLNPNQINPAEFLRASMAIPVFFHPYQAKSAIIANNSVAEMTETGANAVFVDGGVISNFPINVFHNAKRIPLTPTFGVRLEEQNNSAGQEKDSIIKYLISIFNTARRDADKAFIKENVDYRQLIGDIKINEDIYNWLDFDMSPAKKKTLFVEGVKAAVDFVQKFDWVDYKKLRGELAQF